MNLAVLPARGGSKRIKNKNIMDFLGQPMISYPLRALQASGLFDEIHISTDSQEIAETVETLGFRPSFLREPALADDHTPVLDVLNWVLKKYQEIGKKFSSVALVMPCSPLLLPQDFIEGYKVLQKTGGPVLSVAPFPAPVEWAMREESGELKPLFPEKLLLRSQDLQASYYDTGNFCLIQLQGRGGQPLAPWKNFIKYQLPRSRSVDIDNLEDLELAKVLFQALQRNRS